MLDDRPDDHVGQRRQVVGQALDRQLAGQVQRQQAEQLGMMGLAQDVELALGVAGRLAQVFVEDGRQLLKVAGAGVAVVQQFVEQDRVLGQERGGPAAGIDHADHALERVRIFGQQRQVGRTAPDRLEQVEQAAQGAGVAADAGFAHHAGDQGQGGVHQCQQPLPAGVRQARQARTLQGGGQAGAGAARFVVAERGQAGGDRVQVVELIGQGRGVRVFVRFFLVGEDGIELLGHVVALFAQRLQQRGFALVAHHARHRQPVVLAHRQGMGLGVFQVLHAVLEIAQEGIGLQQAFDRLVRQQLALGQQAQGGAGRALAQGRIASAADQLEYLGQELDLADAAAPQFYIVAALGMQALLALHFGADLGVHGADRVDHAEIEVTAEHEGPHDGVQRRDIFRLAGDGARLDPGIALPLAALDDQVFLHHAQAGRQRARFAVGAQRHVDPEREAILDHLGQGRIQAPPQAHEEFMVRQLALAGSGRGLAVFRVDEDQVDVGRHIEFAAALLAHGQHHQVLRAAGFLAGRHAVAGDQFGGEAGDMGLDREVGEGGHGADHFMEFGLAAQVARDDGRYQQVAHAAHGPFQWQTITQFAFQEGAEIGAVER